VNDLVKKLIFEVVVREVLKKIFLAAPFLTWPIVNPLFIWGFTWAAGKIYDEMALVVSFQVIALKTDEQVRKYDAVVKEIVASQEKDVLDEKTREEYRRRLADLIRLRA
jgi:hypothetical protein